MYFDYTNDSTSTHYTVYSKGTLGNAGGGKIWGYFADMVPATASSGNHSKTGFYADLDVDDAATGGTFFDKGFHFITDPVTGIPSVSTGIDYTVYGCHLARSPFSIFNALGGDWNDLTLTGLQLTGWGHLGTLSGIVGTYSAQAIYCDGGDWVLAADDDKILLGASQDASIYYDSDDLIIDPQEVGTGGVIIGSSADLTVGGEIKGSRLVFPGGHNGGFATTTDGYLKTINGIDFEAALGFIFPRAGSVVSVSVEFDVYAVVSGGTLRHQVRINDASVLNADVSVVGTGHDNTYTTQARGTDTFSAGDRLTMYCEKVGLANISVRDILMVVEVCFDD